jgi:hypothetical protein
MTSGLSSRPRRVWSMLSGIMPVSVAPPGSSSFTVIPVPSRSCAQMIVSDASAA